MKRSEINAALKEMEEMVKEYRFAVPPFCSFTPQEWEEKGHDYDEIRDNMLGWDITDYGLGKFEKTGFSLITIRNGNLKMNGSLGDAQRNRTQRAHADDTGRNLRRTPFA